VSARERELNARPRPMHYHYRPDDRLAIAEAALA
jgi:hypothetical protein